MSQPRSCQLGCALAWLAAVAAMLLCSACGSPRTALSSLAGEDAVKAMSFNILHDNNWDARKALVVAAIRQESPDIVGLQEAYVWQLEYLAAEMPQYSFVAAGRDDGSREGETVGILYRADRFEVDTSGTFWFSDAPQSPGSMPGDNWGSPNFPRICTWLRLVQRSTGRGFYHYNVHLQHDAGVDPELARTRSVELLLARIAQRNVDDPVVVTGDFNATELDTPIRHVSSGDLINYCPKSAPEACRRIRNTEPLIDTWREHHTGSVQGTRCFDNNDSGRRIDFVFISPGSEVFEVSRGDKVDGACASDHHYVSATVLF